MYFPGIKAEAFDQLKYTHKIITISQLSLRVVVCIKVKSCIF
jgi:hypothetical protein